MKERLLTNVEPVEVFKYFEDLTFIPRESGNEKEVTDYLIDFAKEHGLEWHRDEYLNVIIRKPAAPGYEDHPGVVLQAHSDMVCEKNRGVEHDFDKEPIHFVIEDGKIVAKETTLGADDGIGVAFALAVLADPEMKHPAIEFVCTSDEERGMSGIENLDFSLVKGSRIINLDSNEEGVIVVGCAGGPVVRVELPVVKKAADPAKKFFEIKIRGLLGGHSGEDIHRGRANANKLIVRVLMAINGKCAMDLADYDGGLKYNAIPRNAEAVIAVDAAEAETVKAIVAEYQEIFLGEYRVTDGDVAVTVEELEQEKTPELVLDEASKLRVLDYINFSETGIIRMDPEYPELVESSISLGTVDIEEEKAVIQIMTRSSRDSMYELMFQKIVRLTELLGGEYFVMSNCPAWQYDFDSEMKKIFEGVYEEMYGEKPGVMIVHAGLEPGEFSAHIDRKLDMMSMGPDARNLHAPGEYLDIASTERVWKCFVKFIENL